MFFFGFEPECQPADSNYCLDFNMGVLISDCEIAPRRPDSEIRFSGFFKLMSEIYEATGFARKRKISRDAKIERPPTVGEARAQVGRIYRENDWDAELEKVNHRMVGIGDKTLAELTGADLRVVLEDFERRGMILFTD